MNWAKIKSLMLIDWATQVPLFRLLWKRIFLNYLFIIWEIECEWGRGKDRGRHRIRSRLQALGGQHRAQCSARTHGSWDRDLSRSLMLNRLSHPGTLEKFFGLDQFDHNFPFPKQAVLFSLYVLHFNSSWIWLFFSFSWNNTFVHLPDFYSVFWFNP